MQLIKVFEIKDNNDIYLSANQYKHFGSYEFCLKYNCYVMELRKCQILRHNFSMKQSTWRLCIQYEQGQTVHIFPNWTWLMTNLCDRLPSIRPWKLQLPEKRINMIAEYKLSEIKQNESELILLIM